ncbi:DinB family protein [Bacillaceae bacterium Marseille-Q3522]|nr:DinB family protein [Bacillaceae bacterium Marseille-Q3522]
MNRIDILRDQLQKNYATEAWYPPLKPALEGLNSAQASWHPTGEAANTIWETVNHLLYYNERMLERLKGNNPTFPAETNDDTFTVSHSSDDESAWQAAVKRTEEVYKDLLEVLSNKQDEDFDQQLSKGTFGETTFDILMHIAYHTGQIVQIRKLQGSWPARRAYE